MLNIVVLNGGRGAGPLIRSLLGRQGLNVTSVVNAYDDGKSTGTIRRFFGMLGPSDIRKVQELMLPETDPYHEEHVRLFGYRYPSDRSRDDILSDLRAFVSDESSSVAGIELHNRKVSRAVRRFLREFLSTLSVVEKARGEDFNFVDCSLMNCIYAGAFLVFDRNLEAATGYIDRLFKLKGTVLPTSIEDKTLVALRENGEMLYSEAEIVELRSNVRIERIYLLDNPLNRDRFDALGTDEKRHYLERHHCFVSVSQGVRAALSQADIIIYSAGTQHSSLYPTYLSTGLAQTISENRSALKVFVTNIGADYETPRYKASDYILGAYRYLCLSDGRRYQVPEFFSVVLINQSRFKADETYVEYDEAAFAEIPVKRVVEAFESSAEPGKHDGEKVASRILSLYEAATELSSS